MNIIKCVVCIVSASILYFYLCTSIGLTQTIECPEATGLDGKLIDYNETTAPQRGAEAVHFKPETEALIEGSGTGSVIGDLNYILNIYPNHHRALWAVSRLQFKQGKPTKPTAECLIQRAIRFKPQDPVVRTIYAAHLHKGGKLDEALQQYQVAEKINPNWSELQYNMGLLYFDLKQYAQAKQHAQRAYQQGYPLSGLRNKLKQVGQWP